MAGCDAATDIREQALNVGRDAPVSGLLPAAGNEPEQAQACQQHGVGFGFRNRRDVARQPGIAGKHIGGETVAGAVCGETGQGNTGRAGDLEFERRRLRVAGAIAATTDPVREKAVRRLIGRLIGIVPEACGGVRDRHDGSGAIRQVENECGMRAAGIHKFRTAVMGNAMPDGLIHAPLQHPGCFRSDGNSCRPASLARFQSVDAALAYCLSSWLEWTIDKTWR